MKATYYIKLFVIIVFEAVTAVFFASTVDWRAKASTDPKSNGLPFSQELADLGDKIFDDQNLSVNRNQACNSCHSAAWGFTGPDPAINGHGAVYEGSIPGRFGDRKPPSSTYSTLPRTFALTRKAGGTFVGGNFWDGRATGERLGNPAAEQAQGPFLNRMEQGLRDEACVVYRVSIASYGADYRAIWGTAIDAIDFPDDIDYQCGFEGPRLNIDQAKRDLIMEEYDKIGISIAVYEESHGLYTSKFDATRKGLYKFTEEERLGMALFEGKGKCAECHISSGQDPAFTDHTFDNIGVPANPENPFYLTHPNFVDLGLGGFLATRPEWATYADEQAGAMRVPTLRNVDLRPFDGAQKAYMHNGVFKSLEEVVHFYNTRDLLPRCDAGVPRTAWGVSCWPAPEVPWNIEQTRVGNLGLTFDEEAALVAFLRTLSDGFVPQPRGNQPIAK